MPASHPVVNPFSTDFLYQSANSFVGSHDSAEETNYFTQRRKDAKENAEQSSYSLLKIVVYVIKFSPILKIFAALRLCVKLPLFFRGVINRYDFSLLDLFKHCVWPLCEK